jgi:acyl-CoA dehydrogenase
MTFAGFELPAELRMLRETAADFVTDEIWPIEMGLDPRDEALPPADLSALQEKARSAGLWYMPVPEEFGGGGLDTFELCVVAEAAAQHRFGVPLMGAGVFGYDTPVVLYGANRAQVEKYLLPTIEHGHEWFTAISEPTGGSDPARAIRTTATLKDGAWVLNGRKMWASRADTAQYGVVYARTGEGRKGISAFIVPADSEGMSVRVVPVLRDHATTEVVFADCRIPEGNLIGNLGDGFGLAERWLIRGRLQLTAQCIGVASRALEMAIEHSRDRETFGAPLASRQAIQFMLADSSVELTAARWLVWEAAWKHAQGDLARHEAARAKLYGTETAFNVIDRVVQIFGGMGVAKEFNIEHWFRSLRIARIVDGASEIQKFIIARDLITKSGLALPAGA